MPPPIPRTQTEGAARAEARRRARSTPGAWPAQTIGTDYPLGADIPINHVIVIMQENRSFDHYLGRLVAQGYYKRRLHAPAAPASHSDEIDARRRLVEPRRRRRHRRPAPRRRVLLRRRTTAGPTCTTTTTTARTTTSSPRTIPTGSGRSSTRTTPSSPSTTRSRAPSRSAIATSARCLTSTWPNRFFLMAATSFGIGDNSF